MRNEEQRGSTMADTKSAMQVDAALVRQLAELLDETHLTEIEVQDGERKIRVARNVSVAAPVMHAPAPTAPAPAAEAAAAPAPSAANALKSPMVGTVFLAAEPGAKPFAAVGDTVTEGQTLIIIEAMKVMNPIAAPRAGKVTQVLVENGQPVEFDQSLIVIE
jgi:acetyl-CoA carboxylase biotin carboxyl carrier protein